MGINLRKKISTKNIGDFLSKHATNELTLVIHSEDYDTSKYFPNAFRVTKRENVEADMHVDTYYTDIASITDGSYQTIVCTGLLEHLPDPQKFVDEVHRILGPGGKVILQASSAFSVHEYPDNFFQFLPSGMRYLFRHWSEVAVTGSCGPYETLAILAQRILLQTNAGFFCRGITVLLVNLLPYMDKLVIQSYGGVQKRDDQKLDSMLSSNIQVVAVK